MGRFSVLGLAGRNCFGKQTPKKGGFFHSIVGFGIVFEVSEVWEVYEVPEEPEEPKGPEVEDGMEKQASRRADPGGGRQGGGSQGGRRPHLRNLADIAVIGQAIFLHAGREAGLQGAEAGALL